MSRIFSLERLALEFSYSIWHLANILWFIMISLWDSLLKFESFLRLNAREKLNRNISIL